MFLRRSLQTGLVVAFVLAACGQSGGGSAPSTNPTHAPALASFASSNPAPPLTTAAPAGRGAGPYSLPDGAWSSGILHLEITGGYEGSLDLPLSVGETSSGRTLLTFANHDDNEFSKGQVILNILREVDSIGIDAGGLMVQGGCLYTFTRAEAADLGATIECADDIQAYVAGDPRLIRVTGSFIAAG